jgi:hypothetical protein
MVTDTVLRKVIKVITSVNSMHQNEVVENYINQYYKMYGMKNKWIVDSYLKNKWN